MKDVASERAYISVDDKVHLLDKSFVNSLSSIEKNRLIDMIFTYVEIFDFNQKRLSVAAVRKAFEEGSCFTFTNDIGFTKTTSEARAKDTAKEYLESHKDCTLEGTDTSCALDTHLCVSTDTYKCAGSSCNSVF